MNNTYLYLSSKGSTNHSDFMVQLPNNISFSPFSQVRLINGIVSLDHNEVEITDDNDTFYLCCDYWNKLNSTMPLIPITLHNGVYNIDEFVDELQEEINLRFLQFPFITVTVVNKITDNKNYLTFKASQTELYGCPTIELPQDDPNYLKKWALSIDYIATDPNGDQTQFSKSTLTREQIPDQNHYGILTHYDNTNPSYVIFQGIMGGINGTDDTNKKLIFLSVIDTGTNKLEPDEYILYNYGQGITPNNLLKNWGTTVDNLNSINNNRFYLKFKHTGSDDIECTLATSDIVSNVIDFNDDNFTYDQSTVTALRISMYEYDTLYDSKYQIIIESKTGTTYTQILSKTCTQTYNTIKNIFEGAEYDDIYTYNNRLGITFLTTVDIYTTTANCDPSVGFNSVTEEFEKTKSLDIDISRPISYLGRNETSNTNKKILNTYYISQTTEQSNTDVDDVFITSYTLPFEATAGYAIGKTGYLVMDKDTEGNTSGDFPTYKTGLTMDEYVDLNQITFPQCYLEINEFPFNTYTANFNGGTTNRFLSPINLIPNGGDTEGEFITNIYTEQYLTMGNSSPLNITSMRVRICDITGKILPNTKENSIFTVEIRDNPYIRERQERQEMIKSIMSNMGTPVNIPKSLNGY
jgi:hypothetical protein